MLFQAGSLLLVIISVYLLKRIHIFSDKSYKVVQGLVFNLTLPCAIIMSFATNKHPMNLLWLVVFGLFACLIPLFVVYFGSRGDEPRCIPDHHPFAAALGKPRQESAVEP